MKFKHSNCDKTKKSNFDMTLKLKSWEKKTQKKTKSNCYKTKKT